MNGTKLTPRSFRLVHFAGEQRLLLESKLTRSSNGVSTRPLGCCGIAVKKPLGHYWISTSCLVALVSTTTPERTVSLWNVVWFLGNASTSSPPSHPNISSQVGNFPPFKNGWNTSTPRATRSNGDGYCGILHRLQFCAGGKGSHANADM